MALAVVMTFGVEPTQLSFLHFLFYVCHAKQCWLIDSDLSVCVL